MGARILIIEDNPANSDLMSYLLTAYGHTAILAETGEIALDLLRTERPDLIICDIHLPGMDGYTIARHIKADPELRAIPLVAVTALAMVGDRERVLAAGFDGYLTKPIEPELFMSQADEYLRSTVRTTATAFASAAPAVSEVISAPVLATVLVADDRPINLSLIRNILEPVGYRVITTASMQDALEAARKKVPDLIISDVHMADGSGFDFIKMVKADPILQKVPFIFLTSTSDTQAARSHGLGLGAERFLFRPIEPTTLIAEVEACLREHKES